VAVALVDSSAIIAYLVEDDALHASAAHAIESAMRAGKSLAMSAVTWSETLHGALLGYFPEADLREFVEDFGIEILEVDAAVAEQAAALQKAYRNTRKNEPRPKLRTPDALILATSLMYAGVDTVIGGDEKWIKVPGIEAEIALLEEDG
jgi:predicted nucleic acid-binding protein